MLVGCTAPAVCASYDDLNVAISYLDQNQADSAIPWFDKAIAAGDLIPDLTRIAYLDRGMIWSAKAATGRKPSRISRQPSLRSRTTCWHTAVAFRHTWPRMNPRRRWPIMKHCESWVFYDYDVLVNTGFLDWQLGNPEAAADAFSYFAPINSPVSWIWLHPWPPEARQVDDPEFKGGPGTRNWPVEVARFYLGHLSEAEVLEKAKNIGTPQAFCTANLLTGLWRKVHHDETGAAPLLQAASESCPKDSALTAASHAPSSARRLETRLNEKRMAAVRISSGSFRIAWVCSRPQGLPACPLFRNPGHHPAGWPLHGADHVLEGHTLNSSGRYRRGHCHRVFQPGIQPAA